MGNKALLSGTILFLLEAAGLLDFIGYYILAWANLIRPFGEWLSALIFNEVLTGYT